MAKLLKLRRGTTSQHSSFTGAEGEVTVDTDKEALVVHNGSTAGGFPVARADGTGVTNFTITGELDAATLDISGNADIDGTLEADAYTVDGTALNEYIADTVGAMVTGNTETGITVTYEDGDNTLDFVVGTLNQNTTGTAANLSGTPDITVGVVTAGSLDISGNADIDGTLEADAYTVNGTALDTHIAGVTVTNATNAAHVSVADNESTNENNKIVFIEDANATGNVGLESDGDFHYNPSTGLLTTPSISTSGNITIAGNLTVNGTTTTVATTNTTVTDNLLELNSGASSNANDAGILIERGSTGDNAIIAWDESADRFTLGTTTATNDATGNISVSTGTLAANIVGNVTGNVTGNTSGSSGSCTGNAATATQLATARNIGGVSFNGTANINLPGVNSSGNQNTSGTAGGLSGTPDITVNDITAASLDISGDADIDGTLEADAYTVNGTSLSEYISDTVGAMVSSNTESGITVTYQDSDNTLDFSVGTLNQNTTGNAATADAVDTTSSNNNATHYLTMVSSSGTEAGSTIRKYTSISCNPNSGNFTVTGTVTDSKGNVRSIPQNTQGSSYTLVAADAGKHILASGTVTIPNSVFAAGDAVTIVNNTSGDLTLTASVGTLYNTADAATGNRTLATRGMATILFASATVAYISGAGLS